MNPQSSIVDHYLKEFHKGKCDNAFHSLIEADLSIIPDLINSFRDAKDVDTKVFLIEVVSEFRLSSTLNFLSHSLHIEEPAIWKAALNGMAMSESVEAINSMLHVLSSVQDSTKRDWIEEVISDFNEAIRNAEQETPPNR